jgi:hypothetical protein
MSEPLADHGRRHPLAWCGGNAHTKVCCGCRQ